MTRIHVNERPLDIDSVLKNLLELEKMNSKDKITSDVTTSKSNNEVTAKEIRTEDYEEENDIILDEDGFRSMVTISEVSNDGSLRKYLVRLKKNGENRWYICNYCSKEFKKPSDLIRHIRVHTKEKPYKVSSVQHLLYFCYLLQLY